MAESVSTHRLVYIEWEDSSVGTSGWSETAFNRASVATVQSVGWLVYDGEDCKLIVPHVSQDHVHIKQQGCGDMTIPTSSVRKLVELDLATPPSRVKNVARKKRS